MAALQEKVVMGKGLGFQVKVGAEVDAARIEKVFALEQADRVATAVPEGVDSIPPRALSSVRAVGRPSRTALAPVLSQ